MAYTVQHNNIATEILLNLGKTVGADLQNPTTREEFGIRALWDQTRKEVLAEGGWKFATLRRDLGSPESTGPEFEYTYRYTLPDNIVRLIEINRCDSKHARFAEENGYLLTDESVAKIKYIGDIEDPRYWTPFFTAAFKLKISAKLAYAYKANVSLKQSLMTEYEEALARGLAIDGMKASPDEFESDDLIDCR